MSMLIVFMMILAGTALGMMLYNISDSLVITIIVQFTIVWLWDFLAEALKHICFQVYLIF